jgi:hypothetical protein
MLFGQNYAGYFPLSGPDARVVNIIVIIFQYAKFYTDSHPRTQNKVKNYYSSIKSTSDLKTCLQLTPETSCPSNIFQTMGKCPT